MTMDQGILQIAYDLVEAKLKAMSDPRRAGDLVTLAVNEYIGLVFIAPEKNDDGLLFEVKRNDNARNTTLRVYQQMFVGIQSDKES